MSGYAHCIAGYVQNPKKLISIKIRYSESANYADFKNNILKKTKIFGFFCKNGMTFLKSLFGYIYLFFPANFIPGFFLESMVSVISIKSTLEKNQYIDYLKAGTLPNFTYRQLQKSFLAKSTKFILSGDQLLVKLDETLKIVLAEDEIDEALKILEEIHLPNHIGNFNINVYC